jgi:hypothetical protein
MRRKTFCASILFPRYKWGAFVIKIHFKPVIYFQVVYTLLCMAWNLIGVWQVRNGVPSLGPTASLMTVSVFIFLALLLMFSVKKHWAVVYLGLSLLLALLACSAIYGGFTKDPNLWPSEFWRYAGIAVNLVGVLGFAMLLFRLSRRGDGRGNTDSLAVVTHAE